MTGRPEKEATTPYEEHVQRLVAAAPALTPDQQGRIRALFRVRVGKRRIA